jgi:hypothetical protein
LTRWPWKSIRLQTLLRTKYVPSLVKILCEHSRINILQWILTKLGTYLVHRRVWNPIDFQGQRSRSQEGFQTLLRTKYVPSLVKIYWRMLILVCSQVCYAVKIWPGDIDLWPRKSIGFQTLLSFILCSNGLCSKVFDIYIKHFPFSDHDLVSTKLKLDDIERGPGIWAMNAFCI